MIDHVAYLCARHADRRSPAVAAGLDQVEAVIRDELDEAGVGPDNPIFDRHAVIVLKPHLRTRPPRPQHLQEPASSSRSRRDHQRARVRRQGIPMSWPEAAVKIVAILVIGTLLLALFAEGARHK